MTQAGMTQSGMTQSGTAQGGMSQGEVLEATARRLAGAGVDAARRESRHLLAAAFGVGPETLLAFPERQVTVSQLCHAETLVARRIGREPLARILGRREFWSHEFKVTADTLVPRPDSETLIESLLRDIGDRQSPLRVLDLGTGGGCLLIALLSELPRARGLGVDISVAALAVARDNARAIGVGDRCFFVAGNWCAGLAPGWDLVVCNPPYIADHEIVGLEPEVRCHEPRAALVAGADGLAAYRSMLPQVPRILAPGGRLAVELGSGQADAVSSLARQAGFKRLELCPDLAGISRCLLAVSDDTRGKL